MGMKLKQLQHLSTLVTIRCHQSEMKNKSFWAEETLDLVKEAFVTGID